MKLCSWPKSQTVAHILSTPGGRNSAYFHCTGSGFRFMGRCSKLSYLGVYFHSTPGGWNWAYFRSMGISFRDMGWMSKLQYLGTKLGHCKESSFVIDQSARSYTYSLFLPQELIFALWAAVSEIWADVDPGLPYLGMRLGQSARSCRYTLMLTQGVEIELIFCSTGSGFQGTGRFSKLPYIGYETWPLAKVPEAALGCDLIGGVGFGNFASHRVPC